MREEKRGEANFEFMKYLFENIKFRSSKVKVCFVFYLCKWKFQSNVISDSL